MHETFLYVGTYTENTESDGIYCFGFEANAAKMIPYPSYCEVENPSYLAIRKNMLYAANEMSTGARITACSIQPDGSLQLKNVLQTPGYGMCHLVLHSMFPVLYASNFGSGDMVSCSLLEDGSLGTVLTHIKQVGSGPVSTMQEASHLHSATLDVEGGYIITANLGNDQLTAYPLNPSTGHMDCEGVAYPQNPGSGPRHFAFHPKGQFAYLINELNNTVTAFAYKASEGHLQQIGIWNLLPEAYCGKCHAADIHISPDGAFLYASTREYDGIAVYRIDQQNGALTAEEFCPTGRWPRHFSLSPCGALLAVANQKSNTVEIFQIDVSSGMLRKKLVEVEVPSPVSVIWYTIK